MGVEGREQQQEGEEGEGKKEGEEGEKDGNVSGVFAWSCWEEHT